MEKLLVGSLLNRYKLLNLIGRGGMAEVYLAQDQQYQRLVAVKVVNIHAREHIERFRREIQTQRSLVHPHILPILGHGEVSDWAYMVMPYIVGGTLNDLLEQGPLTLERTGTLLTQIASALDFAHAHGYIHRDLKPGNILLDEEGRAYLADFGLAKNDEQDSLTRTGYLMGTPEYMAPELTTRLPTPSCDIYSMGILTFQMLTGEPPFTGDLALHIYMKHLTEQPPRPRSLNPAVSEAVEQVILCAMAKQPEYRFATPGTMAQAYQLASQNSPHFVDLIPRGALDIGSQLSDSQSHMLTDLSEKKRYQDIPTEKNPGYFLLKGHPVLLTSLIVVLLLVVGMSSVFLLHLSGDSSLTAPHNSVSVNDHLRKPTKAATPIGSSSQSLQQRTQPRVNDNTKTVPTTQTPVINQTTKTVPTKTPTTSTSNTNTQQTSGANTQQTSGANTQQTSGTDTTGQSPSSSTIITTNQLPPSLIPTTTTSGSGKNPVNFPPGSVLNCLGSSDPNCK